MPKIPKFISSRKWWLNILYAAICGLLLSVPFMRIRLGWLSFFTLIPLLFYLQWQTKQGFSARRIITNTWLVGAVFMGITVSWMLQLNTIGLIQDPVTKMLFIPFTLGLMVLYFSIGFLIFGWLFVKLKISLGSKNAFWLIPSAWVVGEAARSLLFSIGMLGEGGSIGLHWNFGAMGLGAAMTPLVFAARLVGLFGLSFLVAVINVALFQLGRRKFVWVSVACIAGCALLSVLGYLAYSKTPQKSVQKVGIVHLDPDEFSDYRPALLAAQSVGNYQKVDLVIFPEYSHLFEQESQREQDKALLNTMLQPGGRVITTRAVQQDKRETNAIVTIDSENNEQNRQGKTFLIPGGEYIPYLYKAILIASANFEFIYNHEQGYTVYQSKKPIEPIVIGATKYGVLACSGIIAPEFYRDLVNRGAEVLVNSASLSTMGIGNDFFDQAMQMARFQAVANSRTLVQSARGKVSYVMNQDGTMVLRTNGEGTQYMLAEISTNDQRTVYSMLGEWVIIVSGLSLLVYGYAKRKELGTFEFKRARKLFKK